MILNVAPVEIRYPLPLRIEVFKWSEEAKA
jgi:hypothetical protein